MKLNYIHPSEISLFLQKNLFVLYKSRKAGRRKAAFTWVNIEELLFGISLAAEDKVNADHVFADSAKRGSIWEVGDRHRHELSGLKNKVFIL